MSHSNSSGGHDHPKNFDEVIARGFPHEHLEILQSIHEAMVIRPVPSAPKLERTAAAVVTRKDANVAFGPVLQDAFRNAVVRMVEEGIYRELISDHMDMSHNMHGSMGAVGLYRFLGWHRRYLIEFEIQLQRVDAILRPIATERIGIPYWRWQDPFPTWMIGFLPSPDPNTGSSLPARKSAAPPNKADAADIDIIVNQFSIQNTRLPDQNDYTKFTYGLEGWGRRPNGSGLPAHNHGHAWIGGVMNNTSTSPTDPIFWLHHAEVDRLWQIWRQSHPTPAPLLVGADRIMDPWSESYDELLDIAALGYTYDSMSL